MDLMDTEQTLVSPYPAREKLAAQAVFQALIEQAVVRQLSGLELMEHVRTLALERWGTG